MFSKNATSIEILYKKIKEYNKNKSFSEQIKFIHGSSSAVFAFLGKKVLFKRNNIMHDEQIIPNSLIPTGILRKKYGIYPLSGELEIGSFTYGSRKAGINYQYLSGMDVTYNGIATAYEYANHATHCSDVNDIHHKIASLLKYITLENYLSTLKILIMEMTNLMLLDPNAASTGKEYLQLLSRQRSEILNLSHPNKDQIEKCFDKYTLQLKSIVLGQDLPFKSDEHFRKKIFEQFPIIFCSTVEPVEFKDGVPDEKIFHGELNLETVKILLTSFENKNKLKALLEQSSLSSIQIICYQQNKDEVNVNNNRFLSN